MREDDLVIMGKSAEAWERQLTPADIACVRADRSSHVRFLYEDPHAQAAGVMVKTRSDEFLAQAPDGGYWRHAPVVKFSDTPCEAAKAYEGQGAHTGKVLQWLGYDAARIAALGKARVVAGRLPGQPVSA